MTIQALRKAFSLKLFQPFHFCMAGGREIAVPHPEFIFIPPGDVRTVVVDGGQGGFDIVDILLVESLRFANGRAGRRRR